MPLGTAEEVIDHLSATFDAVEFSLVTEEPAAWRELVVKLPMHIRLLQFLFLPPEIGYPRYEGFAEAGIEFCFEAAL